MGGVGGRRDSGSAVSGTVAPRYLVVGSPLEIVERACSMGISRGVLPRAQTSGRQRILLRRGAAPPKKRRSSLLRHPRRWLGLPLGLFPLPAIPVLPYLSVLVGWCRLAGLVHTVPLSLAGCLEGYLTTELLPTGPTPCFGSLVDRPPPGSVRVFL